MNAELIKGYIKKKKRYPLTVNNIYEDVNQNRMVEFDELLDIRRNETIFGQRFDHRQAIANFSQWSNNFRLKFGGHFFRKSSDQC